jgi:hypothetical protein
VKLVCFKTQDENDLQNLAGCNDHDVPCSTISNTFISTSEPRPSQQNMPCKSSCNAIAKSIHEILKYNNYKSNELHILHALLQAQNTREGQNPGEFNGKKIKVNVKKYEQDIGQNEEIVLELVVETEFSDTTEDLIFDTHPRRNHNPAKTKMILRWDLGMTMSHINENISGPHAIFAEGYNAENKSFENCFNNVISSETITIPWSRVYAVDYVSIQYIRHIGEGIGTDPEHDNTDNSSQNPRISTFGSLFIRMMTWLYLWLGFAEGDNV